MADENIQPPNVQQRNDHESSSNQLDANIPILREGDVLDVLIEKPKKKKKAYKDVRRNCVIDRCFCNNQGCQIYHRESTTQPSWADAIKQIIGQEIKTKRINVCKCHFSPWDFTYDPNSQTFKVNSKAIPTMFPSNLMLMLNPKSLAPGTDHPDTLRIKHIQEKLEKVFTKDQVRILLGEKVQKFSEDTILKGLTIRSLMSAETYELVNDFFGRCLPSAKTLLRNVKSLTPEMKARVDGEIKTKKEERRAKKRKLEQVYRKKKRERMKNKDDSTSSNDEDADDLEGLEGLMELSSGRSDAKARKTRS